MIDVNGTVSPDINCQANLDTTSPQEKLTHEDSRSFAKGGASVMVKQSQPKPYKGDLVLNFQICVLRDNDIPIVQIVNDFCDSPMKEPWR